eukprot:s1_g2494.t1
MPEAPEKRKRTFSSLAWHFLWPLLILGVLNLLWGTYIGPVAEEQFGDEVIYSRNCFHSQEAWFLLVCEGNAALGAGYAVRRGVDENRSPYKDDCVLDTTTGMIHCSVTPGVRSWYQGPLAILNIPALILTAPTIASYRYLSDTYSGEKEDANTAQIVLSFFILAIWWRFNGIAVSAMLLASCATPATSPVKSFAAPVDDNNIHFIKASAPLTCTHEATEATAMKIAAIETLRLGHDRFKVLLSETSDNIKSMTSQVIIPRTIPYGNGQTFTTFVPAGYTRTGTRDGVLIIKVVHADDADTDGSINARGLLGPNWESLMETGINSCE